MLQKILEYELKPALGCTEPMAFALCAASARAYAHGAVARIGIEASAGTRAMTVRSVRAVNSRISASTASMSAEVAICAPESLER